MPGGTAAPALAQPELVVRPSQSTDAVQGADGSSGISLLACEGLQSSVLKTTSPAADRIWISLAPEPTSWVQPAVPVLATAMVKEVPPPGAMVLLAVVALTWTCPDGQVPEALGEADVLAEADADALAVVVVGVGLADDEPLEVPDSCTSTPSDSSASGDSERDSPKVGVGLGAGADAFDVPPNAADSSIQATHRTTKSPTATTARRRQ